MTKDFEEIEKLRADYIRSEEKTRANLRAIDTRAARKEELLLRIVDQLQSILELMQD